MDAVLAAFEDTPWPAGGAFAVLITIVAMLLRTLWSRGSDEGAQSSGWQAIVAAKDADLAALREDLAGKRETIALLEAEIVRRDAEIELKNAQIETQHATNAKLAAQLAAERVEEP